MPGTAVNIEPTTLPQGSLLAGTVGAIVGFHYQDGAVGFTQTATVVRRHRRIYLLRVVSDDAITVIGNSAASLVRANWRWR
jgi:hypothetical protein